MTSARSQGSQFGVRFSSSHAQPALIATARPAAARVAIDARRSHSMRPPMATNAAIAGARATV